MRKEIRVSGSGGQGLISAGIILAKAAALYDNKNALQSQNIGPEARGGASKAEVVISDEEINYPKVQSPDAFVALTQEALNKYVKDVKPNCVIIADNMLVTTLPQGDYKIYHLPIITSAAEKLGSVQSANLVALGALNAAFPLVSEEAMLKSVNETFKKTTEQNAKALALGKELVTKN